MTKCPTYSIWFVAPTNTPEELEGAIAASQSGDQIQIQSDLSIRSSSKVRRCKPITIALLDAEE